MSSLFLFILITARNIAIIFQLKQNVVTSYAPSQTEIRNMLESQYYDHRDSVGWLERDPAGLLGLEWWRIIKYK